MPFIFKIKFENTLRRMIVKEAKDDRPDLTFKDLEARIRDMFHIPASRRLVVTYIDQDNEIVTMGDDFDIHDACIVQRIDPLRMEVKVQNTKADGVDHKQIAAQSKSFRSSSTVQSFVNAVEPVNCSKAAASPDQLLSRVAEGCIQMAKVQEALSSFHQGVQFHKGVQCVGCGMVPVMGPWFKSIWKEGGDLCLSCFTGHGDQSDYQRIDKPVHSQRRHNHHTLHKGKMVRHFSSPAAALALKPPHPAKVRAWKHSFAGQEHASWLRFNRGSHHSHKRLDSRFVQHLTFFDGTEVSVGTSFTKSWRLRNTGILPWPSATQLVCVGGDVLGSHKSSSLETPQCGLLSGEEIDASVDLVAPERPGRFVSYWRLMAPTGQKFGQRIWVLIQAIPKPEQLARAVESSPVQSLKQVGEMEKHRQVAQSSGNDIEPSRVQPHRQVRGMEEHGQLVSSSGNGTVDEEAVSIKDSLLLLTLDGEASLPPIPHHVDGYKSMEDSVLDLPPPMQPEAEHATDINVVKSGVGGFSLVERPGEAPIESTTEEMTIEPLPSGQWKSEDSCMAIKPGHDQQMTLSDVADDYELSDCQEDIILGMLNSMGFTQRTLNLELLRKNKNDMQGTVDDLVVASEWDHILDDLEEMI